MKNLDNCIQLKIDKLISNINPTNNDNNQQREENEVTTLISYNHCLDLFDFLQNYSKIQKNEILFQISVIYNILGYAELSLEYTNNSLDLIPNVPTIILFKSGIYASLNRLDEAQKCLLKYKYLIGEDIFNNYIYNIVRIIYYYLLDYEENIILREINLIEAKNQSNYYNNIIFLFIKSKLLNKLSEKYKKIDKKRSSIYKKDSIKNKENAYNIKQIDAEYLFKNDIQKENTTKILLMIYPYFLEYKPKPLILYKNEFHSGFGLFYKLLKICKLLQIKIQIIKYKKIYKNKYEIKNKNQNGLLNDNSLDTILYTIQNDSTNIDNSIYNNNNNIKECQNLILSLSKSIFLQDYIKQRTYSQSSIVSAKRGNKARINSLKQLLLNNKNNNDKINTNYYIYKGFYSNLNLNEFILKNMNLNNEYKEKLFGKDSLLDEINEDFSSNKKYFLRKDDSVMSSKNNLFDKNVTNNYNYINKLSKNGKEKAKINDKIKLIPSNQSKYNINKNNKENIRKININSEKVASREGTYKKSIEKKEKEKIKKPKYISINKINNKIGENIIKHNQNLIQRNAKFSSINKNFSCSYKNLFNSNDINNNKKDSKNNYEIANIIKKTKNNDVPNNKIQKPKIKINDNDTNKLNTNKKQEKNIKYVNSANNIFNNVIAFGPHKLNKSRNNSKLNNDKEKAKKKELNKQNNIYFDEIKNQIFAPLNELEKKQKNPNDIVKYYTNNKEERKTTTKFNIYNNYNNINTDIQITNNNKINITKNTNEENIDNINEIGKYFIKKIEFSKRKKSKKKQEMVNHTEKIEDNKLLEKITFVKTINKSITKKPLSKELKDSKNYTNKERYNTISLKDYSQKGKSNKSSNNYLSYKNLSKIVNNNMHNKIKTYLYYRTMKENPKSENKKRSDLLIKEKVNFLTINLDLLPKTKFGTPTYQKISLFNTARNDSNDKKRENEKKMTLTKISKNSPHYMLNLKRTSKYKRNKINFNGQKTSYNKYINNNKFRINYYYNNNINASDFNKNMLSYRVKSNRTNNNSMGKNKIKTII